MSGELFAHKWQIWIIFKAGFSAAVRETAIGKLWSIIMPIVPLFAFLFLTELRVFPADEAIQPRAYTAVGITLWLYLQGLVMAPASAVSKYREVMKSSSFPIIGLFTASYGQLAFDMLVRLSFVTMFVIIGEVTVAGVLSTFVLLIPATAFAVACGILLGLGSILAKDIRNFAEIVFRYLVFVSFAIFPLPLDSSVAAWLYCCNPFAIFIDNIRTMLLLQDFATPIHFGVVTVLSFGFLMLALHVHNVLERRVAGAL